MHRFTPINSFLASGDFLPAADNLVNNFDPDQDRKNVDPDLGSKPFDTLRVLLKYVLEKVNSEIKA